jgi:hypothetical protein
MSWCFLTGRSGEHVVRVLVIHRCAQYGAGPQTPGRGVAIEQRVNSGVFAESAQCCGATPGLSIKTRYKK